ncbi:hypothetical protein [Amycolatopsis alkalitolerans]|uniref:Uncharacterized protein n=1 Tax=Amycolatopsis alkalitolerans TaxID=2547244 RepID=A0A5C4M8J8_9PSEU|nr:hypothetical protein [Amycolatopsis alkalitolerans]TNC29426.1 hypothetical protein FG385_00120 [Amycolatopsis alkalitolerans]
MTEHLLDTLPIARQHDVLSAVAAVETAELPVPAREFRALMEIPLRHVVEQVLAEAGRVLIKRGSAYITGYDDTIRERLASEGIGVLPPEQRAVLAMVLLLSVAIPRAEGRLFSDAPWTDGDPVSPALLKTGQIKRQSTIDDSLRELRALGLIKSATGGGVVLGAQVLRLTPRATTTLFEEMILVAEPHGDLALAIRRQRATGPRLGSAHEHE